MRPTILVLKQNGFKIKEYVISVFNKNNSTYEIEIPEYILN